MTGEWKTPTCTLPNTNSSHLKTGRDPKGQFILQPFLFGSYVSIRDGTLLINSTGVDIKKWQVVPGFNIWTNLIPVGTNRSPTQPQALYKTMRFFRWVGQLKVAKAISLPGASFSGSMLVFEVVITLIWYNVGPYQLQMELQPLYMTFF